MSTTRGYLYFDSRPGKSNMIVGGTALEFRAAITKRRGVVSAAIETVAGTWCTQNRFYGYDMPINLSAQQWSFAATVAPEDDYLVIQRAADAGRPVSLHLSGFGQQCDTYAMALITGDTVRTSRPVAYNGGTITHVTHPPIAYVDGVEDATVVFPETASGSAWDVVTKGVVGTTLTLHYAAAPLCLIEVEEVVEGVNNLVVSVTARDYPQGVYSIT